MSMPACGWAVRRAMDLKLPTMARATLFVLAEIRGATGKLCPSLPYLCARTGLTDNSQRKWLRVLREAGAIDWIASAGNATHYTLIGFEPPQDVKGSNGAATPSKRAHTPARREGAAPARHEGVRHEDPLKSECRPPQNEGLTPARRAGEPLEPREPRARGPAREGVSDFSRVEESKPAPDQPEPEREPTVAEVEARRAEAMAALPAEVAAAIGGLGAVLSGRAYEPGRPPLRSPADQQAALAPQRPRAAYASGDTLLALRRLSGIRSPPPALLRAAE